MKKILLLLFFLFIPKVNAYNITNYKVDMTILENGNIEVIEMFKMNGDYNGFERKIKYRNNYDGYKKEELVAFDKQLYDGGGINIKEIRSIDYSSQLEIPEIIETGDLFTESSEATKGDYGVYKKINFTDGESIKIYNSSKMNKDFYISYTLKNIAIDYNDISEVMFPLFYDMDETIDNFELTINIPNNKKNLEIWIHGHDSEIVKIDKETIKVNITNLKTSDYFDFRIIFDRIDSNKTLSEDALAKIVELEDNLDVDFNANTNKEYETLQENAYNAVSSVETSLSRNDYNNAYELVNQLNNKDELKTQLLVKLMNIEPKIERKEDITKVLLTSILTIWIIGNVIILYYIYKNYAIKVEKYKYYEEIPSDCNPINVGYLMHKKITNDDLVASILYLIDKDVIKIEKNKQNYILKKHKIKNITTSEEWLLKLIFGDKKEISLIDFEHKAKDYDEFLNIYSNWLNIATNEAEEKGFFVDTFKIKMVSIIYSIIGIFISLFLINKSTYYSSLLVLFIAIISLIYYLKFYKRSLIGNIEYYKWLGLKKYIEKLYTYNLEDLPKDMKKYIIYSISLNCDYSLSRVIKIDEYIYDLADSIIYTINTAYLTRRIVHSNYSSINKNKL